MSKVWMRAALVAVSTAAFALAGCATTNQAATKSGGDGTTPSASPSSPDPTGVRHPSGLFERYPMMRQQAP